MGSLRTRSLGAVLSATVCASVVNADDLAMPAQDQVRFFALCAGRLSALMEHQWMFDGAGSEVTQAQNQAVVAVLEAIMPPGQGPTVLGWRIEAKVAHRALLSSAAFSGDPRLAAAATRQADHLVAPCTALLLG